jgi:hypothetical protein
MRQGRADGIIQLVVISIASALFGLFEEKNRLEKCVL